MTSLSYPRAGALSSEHLADLRRSGLTDETIETLNVFKSINAIQAREVLRWPRPLPPGEYLQIDCPDLDGNRSPLRRRVKTPSSSGLPKYLQPIGVPSFAFFTPRRPGQNSLVITEGEKKSASIWQAGYWAIGLTGVWNGFTKHEKGQERQLIPDIERVDWQAVTTLIIFDTDAYAKSGVMHAAHELRKVIHGNCTSSVAAGRPRRARRATSKASDR